MSGAHTPSSAEERFLALGAEIPPADELPPEFPFALWKRAGSLLFLSGHGPSWGTEARFVGKLGRDLGVEDGYAAARLTGLNLLQTARSAIGSLDRIGGIVEVFGTVSSAPEFTQQSRVVNGCSDLLMHVFGERGRHSRMAVGVAALPFDWAVEVKLIAELS